MGEVCFDEILDRLDAHVREHGLGNVKGTTYLVDFGDLYVLLLPVDGTYVLDREAEEPTVNKEFDCRITISRDAFLQLVESPTSAMKLFMSKKILTTNVQATMKLAVALAKLL